ncbi:MAG TPA: hypothetical protein VIK55_06740 [Paludibacter sp.]
MCLKLILTKLKPVLKTDLKIIPIPAKSSNSTVIEITDFDPEKTNEKQTQNTKTTKMKITDILSQQGIDTLNKQLRIDEGNVLRVYKDSEGLDTIGIGRCLETKGLTKEECDYLNLGVYAKNEVIEALKIRGINQDEADYLLSNDMGYFSTELYNHVAWFKTLPETVKLVLINMAFNLGINGLLGFHTTLGLIQFGNYKEASKQMLNSKWAVQVGDRAKRLSKILALC